MARIAILSSLVAHGTVGISAGAPLLQALGHELTLLPTVVLSNHPGWPHVAGAPVPAEQLAGMVAALEANGWLAGLDAVLTGYLPTPAHVALAADLVDLVRQASPGVRIVTDPVLGDAPGGLYLPQPVAEAVRDDLLPRADLLTPNAFELEWLTGAACPDLAAAIRAARRLGPEVCVTSPPLSQPARTGILEVTGERATLYSTERREKVPHGTGDSLAALLAAGVPPGAALGMLDAIIGESLGRGHLALADAAHAWRNAPAIPGEEI